MEIISACPGRLLDHIERGTIDLSHVEVLVLDEADHMFDMGFLLDAEKSSSIFPKSVKPVFLTMPDDVKSLAMDLLQNPVTIQIGYTAPVMTVAHRFYPVQMGIKTALLKDILEKTENGIGSGFYADKIMAKSLAMRTDKSGHKVISLHGNLT